MISMNLLTRPQTFSDFQEHAIAEIDGCFLCTPMEHYDPVITIHRFRIPWRPVLAHVVHSRRQRLHHRRTLVGP
jgi:hypothetical protein